MRDMRGVFGLLANREEASCVSRGRRRMNQRDGEVVSLYMHREEKGRLRDGRVEGKRASCELQGREERSWIPGLLLN
ncbi:hypothetical protein MA16_Dca006219 [Dendrobium catenatum]|uniref:Uncharacterized protein n=1 Tax=Dendrobium catenatum TaxID=906689 RepID=A0A2I0X4U8_9ASPA|nr:hypothetical protein MA16_Dca006219 [Dendrobium catenatum]